MSIAEANQLLRAGLLEGVRIIVAGGPGEAPVATAVAGDCTGLGARVHALTPPDRGSPEPYEEALEVAAERALAELKGLDVLLVDGAALFDRHVVGAGREALVRCLDEAWSITRAVATRGFIERHGGGRIVYVAPAATQERCHAEAARAALENLARTLSIEWARYGISPVTIAPGASTAPSELAALLAYLASPAGAYFSGCLLDLRGP
jgi:NAD(P)-dependent dehydrogenase (short-subunit alcohol dehydrogenase family)